METPNTFKKVNINYEKKRLIAFIDVMGFKSLLKPSEENIEKLNQYYETILEIQNSNSISTCKTTVKPEIIAISDSLVITIEIEEDWPIETRCEVFANFFDQLANIQCKLALKNIWTRGAVTIGNLYVDTKIPILVGQGFVDVFYLEKDANYPRIILDSKILKDFEVSAPLFCNNLISLKSPLLNFRVADEIDGPADDFMQIDWFGKLLYKLSTEISEKETTNNIAMLNSFFNDLIDRQFEGSAIFLKTQKLIGYLQRAYIDAYNGNKIMRTKAIDCVHTKLKELVGKEPFELEISK